MTRGNRWHEVEALLAGLDGVRLHDDPRGRRWDVRGRLVARQVDDSTLLVRCAFGLREELLDEHPDIFSVRPELEPHEKVLVDVAAGDLEVIGSALRAAWEMQRHSGALRSRRQAVLGFGGAGGAVRAVPGEGAVR